MCDYVLFIPMTWDEFRIHECFLMYATLTEWPIVMSRWYTLTWNVIWASLSFFICKRGELNTILRTLEAML